MLSDLLDQESILLDVPGKGKDDILNKVIDGLSKKVDPDTLERVRTAVFEREAIMSTGVGKGLAIPHGKVKGIDTSYAIFARAKKAIDYNAIDDKPIKLIFLLIGPETSNSIHIKLLSRISRLMNNKSFREKLLACTTRQDLLEVFKAEEKKYFGV